MYNIQLHYVKNNLIPAQPRSVIFRFDEPVTTRKLTSAAHWATVADSFTAEI